MHSTADPPFSFLDPTRKIEITQRNLPHWEQSGACYFITFRTIDSLPATLVGLWQHDRQVWLRQHGIDPNNEDWQLELQHLSEVQQHEFHQTFSKRFHECLDDGHGECLLRQPPVAAIVANSFHHFDGERYCLGDFVVMPNHVHVLVRLFGEQGALQQQCRSWKKFTATEINRLMGRHGHFWQTESYDHLVRDAAQLAKFQRYIAANPAKARLRPGEYVHWVARHSVAESEISIPPRSGGLPR